MKNSFITFALLVLLMMGLTSTRGESSEKEANSLGTSVPILLYHRFGPSAVDSMTVTTTLFESQLRYLIENGYTVIPLRQLVDYRLGKRQTFPSRSLVITTDDGHQSVYTDMFPLLRKYRLPVTLFLYPSAISNAPYAMTWDQLREIKTSSLVDFQSHTFWHPNFKKDRERLKPVEYENFVEMQLRKSKEKLDVELGAHVDMLAWPFGIYDGVLTKKASEAGYVAGFSIERRHVIPTDNVMALPRYLMSDGDREKAFARILAGPPHG
jgi:peptidoglycan/xylan/chitin deacetylase (PgdA/CDA1 family)